MWDYAVSAFWEVYLAGLDGRWTRREVEVKVDVEVCERRRRAGV